MPTAVKSSPKDVFMHLLGVITLYVSVISFIALWWQFINFIFPDPLNFPGYGSYVYDPIRIATSALIVVFPVFILLSWLIGRELQDEPAKRELRIRKWLIYFTLFISAITIIVDLIILINNFLRGDLSTQFLWKILVVLIVAAAVFGYFIWDLRRREKASGKPRLFAWITVGVILGSIIYGFFLVGTPSQQRARRFDEQRINDLQQLQSKIINYWQQKYVLPTNLATLSDIGVQPIVDPETSQPYEYRTVGNLSFNLCANFSSRNVYPLNDKRATAPYAVGPYYGPGNKDWTHESGHVCFGRAIDPNLYRPINNLEPAPKRRPL